MSHKRAIEWTLADIKSLLTHHEQENLLLEYKASLAIGDWTDTKRNELAKDICAFANAAGGIIVIGIGEQEHKPTLLDHGVDTRRASKEAVESALQARIAPRVDNLTIKEIPNPDRAHFSYFVIGIPRSMRAPHMCVPFHRYYKRFNFECVPMEHYEVEDVRRRQSEPNLRFIGALHPTGEDGEDGLRMYHLHAGVRNDGSVIARDVLVRFYIPQGLINSTNWKPVELHQRTYYNEVEMHRFDAYLRDNAGPIPIYPKDDQPYIVTRGPSRKIILQLPDVDAGSIGREHILVQIFADGMRMRSFELSLAELLPLSPDGGPGGG